jgi:hypothetical protein
MSLKEYDAGFAARLRNEPKAEDQSGPWKDGWTDADTSHIAAPMILPADVPGGSDAATTPYFYRGIAHYAGRAMKCQGIATSGNLPFLIKPERESALDGYTSDYIIVRGYLGDRISADTFESISL